MARDSKGKFTAPNRGVYIMIPFASEGIAKGVIESQLGDKGFFCHVVQNDKYLLDKASRTPSYRIGRST